MRQPEYETRDKMRVVVGLPMDTVCANDNGALKNAAVFGLDTHSVRVRLDVRDLSIGSDVRLLSFQALMEDSDQFASQQWQKGIAVTVAGATG